MQQSALNLLTNIMHYFPNVLLPGSFWLQKITTDLYIFARVNTECLEYNYRKLKIYFSELILDNYKYKQQHSQQRTADWTLIKQTVARFVGAKSFLIGYSKGHANKHTAN